MTPAFDTDLSTLIEQCETFVEVVAKNSPVHPDAAICTFFLHPTQTIASSKKPDLSDLIERIHESPGAKPVSDALEKSPAIQEGTFQEYFDKNEGNPLVENERAFVHAANYDIASSKYIAVPFPSNDHAKGIFFYFCSRYA